MCVLTDDSILFLNLWKRKLDFSCRLRSFYYNLKFGSWQNMQFTAKTTTPLQTTEDFLQSSGISEGNILYHIQTNRI